MNKKIADRWAKALRSGRYKQRQACLRKGDEHCCLGVLCRILRVKYELEEGMYLYDGNGFALGRKVMKKSGIHSRTGRIGDTSLAVLNDGNVPFTKIADIIEANWKDL